MNPTFNFYLQAVMYCKLRSIPFKRIVRPAGNSHIWTIAS